MFEQLENLLNLYKNNSSKFKFDNDKSNIIEFNDKKFDNLLLSISLNNINNIYYIFLYIEEESKIIFKGLIQKSESNIKNLRKFDKVFSVSKSCSEQLKRVCPELSSVSDCLYNTQLNDAIIKQASVQDVILKGDNPKLILPTFSD